MVRRGAGEGRKLEAEELDSHSTGEANDDAENVVGDDDHDSDDDLEHNVSIELN